VGVTRAKQRLYILSAKRRYIWGKIFHNSLSPFVLDIEERLKEHEKQIERKKKTETQLSLFRI